MDSNYNVIFCADDNEHGVYCDVCYNLCIERCFKNHLKSQTHINNNRKTQQLNKAFQVISQF